VVRTEEFWGICTWRVKPSTIFDSEILAMSISEGHSAQPPYIIVHNIKSMPVAFSDWFHAVAFITMRSQHDRPPVQASRMEGNNACSVCKGTAHVYIENVSRNQRMCLVDLLK
jgi:hypothetical protein